MAFKTSRDPEEVKYARKVACTGTDQSREGKHYYTVSSLKLLNNMPGAIRVGCLVETENERVDKQCADQDFGTIKIMFYALFRESQLKFLTESYPDIVFYNLGENEAVFLTWKEYKTLIKI
ncbi:MAG TPA: hypothetical protein VF837_04035 [Patescibacteria group bacterium]